MAELVVLNGVCAGTVFVLPEIPAVLGRSPESHLQVGDPWISSMHAMLERRGEHLWIIDLESRNGTFVGDERVTEARLVPGAVFRVGRTEVRYDDSEPSPDHPAPSLPDHDSFAVTLPPLPAGGGDGRSDLAARLDAARQRAAEDVDPLELATRSVAILRVSIDARALTPGPAAAHRIRAALDACARAAVREGALVARLAGTGVVALFGAAAPAQDDVVRALRAARVARAAVRALEAGIDVRAAVDSGELLAGDVGGAHGFELAALGPAATRAERLVAIAAAGEVLVPAAVAAGAPGLEAAGTRDADGGPVEVLRLAEE